MRSARSSTESRKVASASSWRGFERAAFDGERLENLRQVVGRAERQLAVARESATVSVVAAKQRRTPLPRRSSGCSRARRSAPHRRQREAAHRLDNAIEFEGPQGAWLHSVKIRKVARRDEAGTLIITWLGLQARIAARPV